jgi:LPXTG-site transpeptidase (sortase) family protein
MPDFTHRQHVTHRGVNNALTVVVVLFSLYILAGPYIPQIRWWVSPPAFSNQVPGHGKVIAHTAIPKDNLLIIPRLGMRQTVNTGPTLAELRKGTWLIPKTSTPDQPSNTVIAGHRYTYAGPGVFYFLDKVQLHDSIIIDWQGKEYTYRVSSIKVVPPTDSSVQAASKSSELTIYTCTPLWTFKNRLVVTAPLVGVRS